MVTTDIGMLWKPSWEGRKQFHLSLQAAESTVVLRARSFYKLLGNPSYCCYHHGRSSVGARTVASIKKGPDLVSSGTLDPGADPLHCFDGSEGPPMDPACPNHDGSDRRTSLASLSCGFVDANALSYGRLLHAHLIRTGSDIHSLTESHLVQMYCKCGCLEDAYALFNAMHPRSYLSTWNIMIGTCIKHGRTNETHQHFNQMLTEGFMPSKVTFANLLSACANQAALPEGRQLHAQIRGSELHSDVVVGTALVVMYGKCSSLEDARLMFDSMPARDVISWTVLINAYVQHGKNKLALEVFDLMQQERVIPNKVTFISICSACSSKDALNVGKEIHAYIKKSGFESDMVIGNALVSMYGKCGSLENARTVFDSMLERNVISWNAIISAYAQNGEGKEALCMVGRMQQGTLPDDVTFVSALDACASLASLTDGKWIHCCIVGSRLESSITLGNALVNMYGKGSSLEEASRVFEKMHEHNEITWNALISVFANKGQGVKALHLFYRMQQEGMMPNKITFVSVFSACASQGALTVGKQMHSSVVVCDFRSDVVIGTAIVNMYGKSHSPGEARQVFDRMPDRNVVSWTAIISAYAQNGQANEAFTLFNLVDEKYDSVLWNSIISAFSQNGHGKKALALFEQMLHEGVMPDRVTFVSSLDAAAREAVLRDGKRLHCCIVGSVFGLDDIVQNALVSMYGKCGSLEVAWKLFWQLPKRDVFSWSSMIAAYAQIGQGKEALHIFNQMQQEGVMPDKVTFVNVLSACSHAGLVREGCRHFASMNDNYAITPIVDHYNCMIDLFGRSGRLDEAEELIRSMRVCPTVVSWLTLLSACRNNVDVRRGEWAAESVFKLDPINATPYIMLSSIYAAAGQPSDAANVMEIMRSKGLKQDSLSTVWKSGMFSS